jgi:HEAT repeat protein
MLKLSQLPIEESSMVPSRLWLAVALAGLCTISTVIGQVPPPANPPGTPPSLTPPAGTVEPPPMVPKSAETRPTEWPKSIYGKTVQDFITEFNSSDPTVREIAVRTLTSFGPDARKVYMKPLLRLISDPDPGVRIHTIMVIGSMPIESKDDMRAAAESLRGAIQGTVSGSAIRLTSAKTLSLMGPEAINVLPAVMALSEDAWWETRQAAALAVGRIGAPLYEPAPAGPAGSPPKPPLLKRAASKVAVEKLLNSFLNDKSSAVRLQAAQSLIALGPPTTTNPQDYIKTVKPWLDIVNEKLKTDNKSEKDTAVRIWLMVVSMMYDERSIETNVERITAQVIDGDVNLKLHALNAFVLLGSKAKSAMPEVRKLLHHNDANVVVTAISAILAQGEDAKYSLEEFDKALNTVKDPGLRDILRRGQAAVKQQAEPKKPVDPKKPAEPKK